MNYISNAISLNMFAVNERTEIAIEPCTSLDVPKDAVSAIGYSETAEAATRQLGRSVQVSRISISLAKNDALFIFQYLGERLPKGVTEVPDEAHWKWFKVTYRNPTKR